MKFAIITDIHGNYPALKAVLEEIDRDTSIQHIYCLGDLIAIGPDTNDVLEEMFNRDDVTIITGNHDEAVLALIQNEPYPVSHQDVKEHHQWIANRLNPKYIEKMLHLPRVVEEEFEGRRMLFTHYHIGKNNVSKPICDDPFSKIVEPSLTNLVQLFNDVEVDLICFGHHHPKHFFQNEKTIYLNPGALGCNNRPQAPYAIVQVSEEITIELRSVPYDNNDFLNSYEKLKVPERDFILKIFHGNQLQNI